MAEEDLTPQDEPEVIEEAPPEEEVDTPQSPAASDEDSPSAESLAVELGWAPRDKWRGAEEDWADAKTFLKNTVDINKSLRRDLKATREASERAARAAAQITERAVEQERQSLLQQRREAMESFDPEALDRADKLLQELPRAEQQVPAETREFMDRNSAWYGIDPIATQMAQNITHLHSQRGADIATQLDEVEKAIRKRFPEYFEPEQRPSKQPANVEVSTTRSSAPRKGPRGFSDLPADAKAAALDFERRGRATKDEYAQLYWQENA